MKPVTLIDAYDCIKTREYVKLDLERDPERKRFSQSFTGNGGCGALELVIGTGRATCRQCGEKIAKGESAIKGCYDVSQGANPWLMSDVQIHLRECTDEHRGSRMPAHLESLPPYNWPDPDAAAIAEKEGR
jgi:hypothetical protein